MTEQPATNNHRPTTTTQPRIPYLRGAMLEDLFRVILKVPPSQKRIQRDLGYFRTETKEWRDKLIPWEEEKEMELFSLNSQTKWSKQGFDKVLKGVYYSIYNEPMLTFGFKNYIRNSWNTLIWGATHSHEFIYRGKKKQTDFFIDRQHVGHITDKGLMYSSQSKRLLGRRNDLNPQYYSVVIWDREVAHLMRPKKADRINPRAFEVMEEMTEQEELLLMALGFLTIIRESNNLRP